MIHKLLILLAPLCLNAGGTLNFDIPEKQLGPALELYSRQSGVVLSFDRKLEKLPAQPVKGSFSPSEALALILAPAGLSFRFVEEKEAVVTAPDVSEAIVVSAAVRDLDYRATVGATATKTDTMLSEIPQAIQVVPGELLEHQEARRLGGALANVSGVQERGTFLGAYEQFAIRGFVLDNRTNYYRDGRKYSNFVAPATEVLERVEVLKGPGSVLFGQASPGGIVNFVTRQAPSETDFALKLGSGDQGREALSLNYGTRLGSSDKLFLRLVGSSENEDRFRDFIETERRVLYASLRYEVSQALSFTFHFDDLKSDTVADSGLVAFGDQVIDQPLTTNYNEPWARYDSDNTNMGYRMTALLTSSWQVRHSFNAQRLERLRIDAHPILVDENNGFVFRRARERNQDYDNDFADVQLVGDVSGDRVRHTLLFGAEYVSAFNNSRETANIFIPISLFEPEHTAEQPTFTPRAGNSSDVISEALFVQDQIDIGESFDILLGLRYDRYETEVFVASEPGGPKTSAFVADSDAVTSRLGAVWHPKEGVDLYAGFSEGFVPNLDTRTAPPTFLDPEESSQLELGLRYGFGQNFTMNVAAFDLEKNNILRYDPATETASLIGKQVHQGVELDAAGELMPGWQITASYAWLDAEIDEDFDFRGNTPQNVPEHSGGLWSSYHIRDGALNGLRVSAGLRMVGSRFGDDAESFVLPAYERFDIGLGYKVDLGRGRLVFNAKLENLTDEEYYLGALSRTQITPGEPRRFLGSLQYQF